MAGISRTLGTAQQANARAITADMRAMVRILSGDLRGVRDRTMLMGFAGAFRRSELVALNVEDIEACPDGLFITIRHSKPARRAERLLGVAGVTMRRPAGARLRQLAAWRRHQQRPGLSRHFQARRAARPALGQRGRACGQSARKPPDSIRHATADIPYAPVWPPAPPPPECSIATSCNKPATNRSTPMNVFAKPTSSRDNTGRTGRTVRLTVDS